MRECGRIVAFRQQHPAALTRPTLGGRATPDSNTVQRERDPTPGVLLVEDDDMVRDVLCEALGESGTAVLPFANAEAALRDPCMRDPDTADAVRVLVTDIDLGGGMDGLTLGTAMLRRSRHVGVVYITAADQTPQPGPRERLLIKPFALQTLLGAIAQLRTEILP
jgi:CheY-like chemotaxis protein